MPHANLKTIYVSRRRTRSDSPGRITTPDERRDVSMGDIVASLLDPRTPDQRVADEFAAEVRDTQESDRP